MVITHNMLLISRTDVEKPKAWPHQDQNPEKPDFKVLQGLVTISLIIPRLTLMLHEVS